MREIVSLTGGLVVQADTFHNPVFKDSLKRLFLKEGEEGFIGLTSNASLEVIPSKDVKVCGLLGPAARMEKKGPHISDTEVGLGGTTQWRKIQSEIEIKRVFYQSGFIADLFFLFLPPLGRATRQVTKGVRGSFSYNSSLDTCTGVGS